MFCIDKNQCFYCFFCCLFLFVIIFLLYFCIIKNNKYFNIMNVNKNPLQLARIDFYSKVKDSNAEIETLINECQIELERYKKISAYNKKNNIPNFYQINNFISSNILTYDFLIDLLNIKIEYLKEFIIPEKPTLF